MTTTTTRGRPALPPPPGVTRVRLTMSSITVSYGGETQRWLWRNLKNLTFARMRGAYLSRGYTVVISMAGKNGRVHTMVLEKTTALVVRRFAA